MDWTVPVKVTPANLTFVLLFACATCPFMALYFYGLFRLLFGTLYPAYSSYKAVKTKNVKEYVKWMMYWIVFALFTCAETFTDVFLSFWFPFYYEIKIILVLWLLSPATRGSSILYRKFVHPQLTKREKEIDEYLARAKEQGYHTVVQLGTRGFNYASQMLLQTALKLPINVEESEPCEAMESSLEIAAPSDSLESKKTKNPRTMKATAKKRKEIVPEEIESGGTLVNHLRRSYSLSDLEPQGVAGRSRLHRALPPYSDEDQSDQVDTGADDESYPLDDLSEAHSTTALNRGEDSEPELSDKRYRPPLPTGMIRSRKGEDPSSGYSSAENLSTSAPSVGSPSLERDRPGLQTRGSLRSRSGKAVSTSHISGPTAPGKRTQHSEVSAYATLPRTTKRATRRKNTAVS